MDKKIIYLCIIFFILGKNAFARPVVYNTSKNIEQTFTCEQQQGTPDSEIEESVKEAVEKSAKLKNLSKNYKKLIVHFESDFFYFKKNGDQGDKLSSATFVISKIGDKSLKLLITIDSLKKQLNEIEKILYKKNAECNQENKKVIKSEKRLFHQKKH